MSVPTALTDEEIIARYQSGELLNDLATFGHDEVDPGSLLNRCIQFHNSRQIDLLQLTSTSHFVACTGHRFFSLQQFFCKAIPKLEVHLVPLMQAVEVLVTKGGNDLMASAPYEAFSNWCAADLTRAHAIVEASEKGDATSIKFLNFALRALGNAELARSFVTRYTDERRLEGLFALGRIAAADATGAEETIGFLIPFVDSTYDDAVRCNALSAALEVGKQFPPLAPGYLPKIIVLAAVMPSQAVLFNLAQRLWLDSNLFDRASIRGALEALKAADPTFPRITHALDMAMTSLLATPHGDLVMDFLTDLLAPHDTRFDLDQFGSIKHELITGRRERLFQLLVRWLLSCSSSLGNSTHKLLTTGERVGPFDTSTSEMGLSAGDHILLAYKALGWLFTHEVITASILVASLRGCDTATAERIGELLFDPLLINYRGEACSYLKTITSDDAAYGPVKRALEKSDEYIAGLKIKQPIKELWPSEYQRSVERAHAEDMMRAVQREAEKQSVLLSLVHRSTLLYGRKSITFIHGPDNKRRSVSLNLHSFSTSFEIPRMEIVDPVGLNIMLLAFRTMKST